MKMNTSSSRRSSTKPLWTPALSLLGLLLITTPAHAGALCSWLGIGCKPVSTTGRSTDDDAPAPTTIDQNNPPEVFAFTVSGTFNEWTDIAPETFVCDTRKRNDRTCIWEGHIPEIKRNATIVFEPFAHDHGMYDVRALIAHNLGEDLDYYLDVTAENGLSVSGGISISWLASNSFHVTPYKRVFRQVDLDNPLGDIVVSFKEVLK